MTSMKSSKGEKRGLGVVKWRGPASPVGAGQRQMCGQFSAAAKSIHIQGGALLQFEENCLFAGAVRVDLHHINESKLAVEIDKVLPGTAFALY
jgi:hypothetical protein